VFSIPEAALVHRRFASAENTKGVESQQRRAPGFPQVPQAWMLGFPQYPQIPVQFSEMTDTLSDLREQEYKHMFGIGDWA